MHSGKLPDCSVGNLPWIANTRRCDFDDFFGEDIHHGVVTINAEREQRNLERLVQPLDLFRLQLASLKKPIDGHGSSARVGQCTTGRPPWPDLDIGLVGAIRETETTSLRPFPDG